jgi:uncharacterized protein (DUF111 family)
VLAGVFTDSPMMTVETIGHGAGSKDPLDRPNILRVLVGRERSTQDNEHVVLLETNLDDCPGEIVGYTIERLLAAGALDAFAVPILMKKSRPGVILSAIVNETDVSKLEDIIFRETGSFGIRRSRLARTTLNRETVTVSTPWGSVHAKRGHRGDFEILTPEYEDCARLAREHGVPLRDVYDAVAKQIAHPDRVGE